MFWPVRWFANSVKSWICGRGVWSGFGRQIGSAVNSSPQLSTSAGMSPAAGANDTPPAAEMLTQPYVGTHHWFMQRLGWRVLTSITPGEIGHYRDCSTRAVNSL